MLLRIYTYCARSDTYAYGPAESGAPGQMRELAWIIPESCDGLITEIGIVCEVGSSGEKDNGTVFICLSSLKAGGEVSYTVDFSKEQIEDWSVFHQPVSQFTKRKGQSAWHARLLRGTMERRTGFVSMRSGGE